MYDFEYRRPSTLGEAKLLLAEEGAQALGGGQAVGSLLLIEEDGVRGHYAKLLCKYFLAEGVTTGQSAAVACCLGPETAPAAAENLMKELPVMSVYDW